MPAATFSDVFILFKASICAAVSPASSWSVRLASLTIAAASLFSLARLAAASGLVVVEEADSAAVLDSAFGVSSVAFSVVAGDSSLTGVVAASSVVVGVAASAGIALSASGVAVDSTTAEAGWLVGVSDVDVVSTVDSAGLVSAPPLHYYLRLLLHLFHRLILDSHQPERLRQRWQRPKPYLFYTFFS